MSGNVCFVYCLLLNMNVCHVSLWDVVHYRVSIAFVLDSWFCLYD